jgi:hypothetical protein
LLFIPRSKIFVCKNLAFHQPVLRPGCYEGDGRGQRLSTKNKSPNKIKSYATQTLLQIDAHELGNSAAQKNKPIKITFRSMGNFSE